ncbi:MAG: efflux RND transporter periplasmic adaptor subunit [Peptostreptococcaceae bacterium]|nr:efflux RND transporter periplasmic adaptor subunit [Peptostreptococcaceae bacterium]
MKIALHKKLTEKFKSNNNQKKKKTKKWVMIAIVLIAVSAGGFFYMSSQNKGLPVEVHAAKKGSVLEYVEETAYAKSENEHVVYSDVSGVVKEVNVREGDSIKAGDVLATIEGDDIELQIKSLSSQLSGANASATYSYVEAARLARDEASRTLDNMKKLFEEGAISQDDYLKAQTAYNVAQQSYRQFLSQYNSARAQSQTIGYEIDLLENSRDKLAITSKEDTLVTRMYVKEGEYVTPGMPLFEMGSMEELFLEADILVSDVGDVKIGQTVLIENEDIGLEEIKGVVERISPKAFSKVSELGIEQKRVKIEMVSEALADRIRLGYEVDVKIITRQMDDILRVPDNAVFKIGDEPHVFVVEGGKTVLKPIKVIFEGNDYFAIENGVVEGDVVVLSPGNELEEGIKVSVPDNK